jgi:hypothetical protein
VPELVARGAGGAKFIAIGAALGMAVPIPGFALIGALGGAVVAAPPVQVPVVRYILDHAYHRMVLSKPAGRADLLLHVEMAAAVVRVGKPKFGAVATFSLQVFGATTQPPCSLLKN